MTPFEIELTRLTFGALVLEAIGFAVAMWVLYYVIRCAIRDGIKDSGLAPSWRDTVARTERPAPSAFGDLRADR